MTEPIRLFWVWSPRVHVANRILWEIGEIAEFSLCSPRKPPATNSKTKNRFLLHQQRTMWALVRSRFFVFFYQDREWEEMFVLFCVFFYLSYISCLKQGKANEPARFCFLCVFGRGRLPLSLEDRERGFFFLKKYSRAEIVSWSCLQRTNGEEKREGSFPYQNLHGLLSAAVHRIKK